MERIIKLAQGRETKKKKRENDKSEEQWRQGRQDVKEGGAHKTTAC